MKLVMHSGSQARTSTFMVLAPEEGVGVALMCNTNGANLRGLGHDLIRELLRARSHNVHGRKAA